MTPGAPSFTSWDALRMYEYIIVNSLHDVRLTGISPFEVYG